MAKKKSTQDVWKCLSIQQPHAWAIILGAKDVENRSWKCNHLGRLYIHAGLTECDDTVVDEVIARVANHLRIPISAARDAYGQHRERSFGAIVGFVRMVGCATSYDSDWFEGEYGFILKDPEPLDEPVPCKGRQRLFTFNS